MIHPQTFFRDTSVICCDKIASHEWQEAEGGGGAQVCLIAIVHVGGTGTGGSERPWDRSRHAARRPMWAEVRLALRSWVSALPDISCRIFTSLMRDS